MCLSGAMDWKPISIAPSTVPLSWLIIDRDGPHAIVFPCRLNSGVDPAKQLETNERIDLPEAGTWREWVDKPPRLPDFLSADFSPTANLQASSSASKALRNASSAVLGSRLLPAPSTLAAVLDICSLWRHRSAHGGPAPRQLSLDVTMVITDADTQKDRPSSPGFDHGSSIRRAGGACNQPTCGTRFWAFASAAVAGCAGSWSTVAS